MIKEIKMPNLGTTVDEVKIVRWFKNIGDHVDRGEAILEVETDKANMEVEAYLAGYLKKIVKQEEEYAAAGDVIAYIGDEEDVFSEPTEACADTAAVDPVKAPGKTDAVQIKISPMVRKLAEKHSVDITKIVGTGPDGLIMKEDVLRAAAAKNTVSDNSENTASDNTTGSNTANAMVEIVPFSRNGIAVANAMTKSKSTIPHVYFNIDVDATAIREFRESSQKKYSYNAILLYYLAQCLQSFPYLMSRYDEKGRIMAGAVNIGLAVAKGDDLYVPVIKGIGPGLLSSSNDPRGITSKERVIAAIQQEIDRLLALVASGNLKQEDISGGVFTLTNLGSYGISSFTAVINPPEAGILAVGAIRDQVVVIHGELVVRPILTLTLSVDHRVVNGSYTAQFLALLKEKLERME